MRKTIFFIFLFYSLSLISQDFHDFGFQRNQTIDIYEEGSQPLQTAWGGGMNSVRASKIDLNLDGKKDLLFFEKNGNRILPFINEGGENEINYRYAPEYKHYFPKLHDWAILVDYNGDGKEDIFTYGLAGITVYKNISDTVLKFELVTNQLQSYYYNGYVNIFCSPDDYIAIDDIDMDGDLDILNFWVLGRYVHYQKNFAVENGNNLDIFDFRLTDECWGKFAEGADDNSIELFVDCGDMGREDTRHIGSTIFAYDYTGSGTKDLIVGDIDYPGIVFLENGGTLEDALMISQTSDFPNAVQPISIYSMPAVTIFDISNDETPEIIASPADPSLVKSENINSVWLYQKNSETSQYELITRSFLQEDMIDMGSGAYPILYDWNQDGLLDLFIANYGIYDSSTFYNYYLNSYYSSSIAYYENVGNDTTPIFQLITRDFGNLRQFGYEGLYPVLDDFNGDGIPDLLCGNKNGDVLLFLNQSTMGELPILELSTQNYNIQVGKYSTPQYFDLDGDGKKDLLIGNQRGKIAYYRNISTNDIPQFELVTEELGGVDVRDYNLSYFGHAVPCFFKNNNDEIILFCGNEQGKIAYYKNIEPPFDTPFVLMEEEMFEVHDNQRFPIAEGVRIGVAVGDINGDGWQDLLVGNWAGGLSYFQGTTPPDLHISINDKEKTTFESFPNPTSDKITFYGKNISFQKVEVYSIAGMLIDIHYSCSLPYTLDFSSFHSGFYLVQFTDKIGNKYVQKVIISR